MDSFTASPSLAFTGTSFVRNSGMFFFSSTLVVITKTKKELILLQTIFDSESQEKKFACRARGSHGYQVLSMSVSKLGITAANSSCSFHCWEHMDNYKCNRSLETSSALKSNVEGTSLFTGTQYKYLWAEGQNPESGMQTISWLR